MKKHSTLLSEWKWLAQAMPKLLFLPAPGHFSKRALESGSAPGVVSSTALLCCLISLAMVAENTFSQCSVSRCSLGIHACPEGDEIQNACVAPGRRWKHGLRCRPQEKVTAGAVLRFVRQTPQPPRIGPEHVSALKRGSDVLLTWPWSSLGRSGQQIHWCCGRSSMVGWRLEAFRNRALSRCGPTSVLLRRKVLSWDVLLFHT